MAPTRSCSPPAALYHRLYAAQFRGLAEELVEERPQVPTAVA